MRSAESISAWIHFGVTWFGLASTKDEHKKNGAKFIELHPMLMCWCGTVFIYDSCRCHIFVVVENLLHLDPVSLHVPNRSGKSQAEIVSEWI